MTETVKGRPANCKHKWRRAKELEGVKQGAIWHKVKRCKVCKAVNVTKSTKLDNRR